MQLPPPPLTELDIVPVPRAGQISENFAPNDASSAQPVGLIYAVREHPPQHPLALTPVEPPRAQYVITWQEFAADTGTATPSEQRDSDGMFSPIPLQRSADHSLPIRLFASHPHESQNIAGPPQTSRIASTFQPHLGLHEGSDYAGENLDAWQQFLSLSSHASFGPRPPVEFDGTDRAMQIAQPGGERLPSPRSGLSIDWSDLQAADGGPSGMDSPCTDGPIDPLQHSPAPATAPATAPSTAPAPALSTSGVPLEHAHGSWGARTLPWPATMTDGPAQAMDNSALGSPIADAITTPAPGPVPVVTLLSSHPGSPCSFEITSEFTTPHIYDMVAATAAADLRAANNPQAMGVTPDSDGVVERMAAIAGAPTQPVVTLSPDLPTLQELILRAYRPGGPMDASSSSPPLERHGGNFSLPQESQQHAPRSVFASLLSNIRQPLEHSHDSWGALVPPWPAVMTDGTPAVSDGTAQARDNSLLGSPIADAFTTPAPGPVPVVTLLSSNPGSPSSFEITLEFTTPHIYDMAAATPAADLRPANDPQAIGVTPQCEADSGDMVELLGAIHQGPFLSE